MRELKFRGRTATGKWVYGDLRTKTDDGEPVCELDGYDVNPDSVGQLTGLKDKNRKEIYEGDIVRLSAGHPSWIAKPFQVIFLYGAFQFNQPPLKGNTAIAVYFNDCLLNLGMENDCDIEALIEVIGNIYEHPNLLQ